MTKLILLAFVLLCAVCLSQGKARICTMPIEKGPCNAHIKAYGYNFKKDRCERFYYGGCGGNDNRFKHKKDCKRVCGKRKH